MNLFEVSSEKQFQNFIWLKTYIARPEDFRTKDDWERAKQYIIDHATEEELAHLEQIGII